MTRRLPIIIFTLLFITSFHLASARERTDEAQRLYETHQNNVYQIQAIDLSTKKKAAAGSGFQFTAEGHIATNYHVISNAILFPKRYRIECIRSDGSTAQLKVIDIDVIHDIAIVKSEKEDNTFIALKEDTLSKGAKIFSLGNPFDLGMTIIEGTYNGLMEKSLYRKILFSGSLNPGMSGGPALNHGGEVIGINVSTVGNQVSFLVPVDHLKNLYANLSSQKMEKMRNWHTYIEKQIIDNQNRYIGNILSSPWDTVNIGDYKAPGELMNVFKCWGDSLKEEDKLYTYSLMDCQTEDQIFISHDLYTGRIMYQYTWLKSKGLNPIRFYEYFERMFSKTYKYDNADKNNMTNFECSTEFVDVASRDWRVAMCARKYKKYPNIYDINLSLASVNDNDRGLKVEIMALGLNKQNIKAFVKKFLEEIKWITK